jgi:streptogrisin D
LFGIRNSIPRGVAVIASSLGLAATALFTTQAQSADIHTADDSTGQAARGAMLAAQDVVGDLGAKAAGAYVSGDTMIVNVTKRSAFDDVRATGATPQLVEHSTAALERVMTVIDRRTDIVGTSWGIDQTSNQVFIRADESVSARELARLRAVTDRFDDKVDIQRIPGKLTTTISGGDAIWGGGGRCSLGFHVTDGAENFFLTAGHCTDIISSWYEDQGQTAHVGDTVDGSFPGDDYGLSTMTGDGGAGDVNLYDGSFQDITAARDAVVGETVWRSGSTTGLHSGTVLATDVSVTYPEGTVDGLIETDVCAEPGDSGGSLFSGSDAIGLTSGGSGNCTFGGMTYFQPVTEALSVYGMDVY